MSKSSRTSNRNVTKSTAHAPASAAGRNDRAPGRPRINFGPARAAAHDLVVWMLGLAEREVANWPEGRRRVRSTRRYVLAQLRCERPQRCERPRIGFMGDDAQLIVPPSPTWQGAPITPVAPLTALLTALQPRRASVQSTPVSTCEQCGQVDLRFRVAA